MAITSKLSKITDLTRVNQWWAFKLPLPIGIACAYAYSNQIGAGPFAVAALLLLLCGVTAALFASVINDIADLEQDRLAGKERAIVMLGPTGRSLVLSAVVGLSIATALTLQKYCHPYACLSYLAIIAVFMAYSIEPVRLKRRSYWGLMAVALGEHVLPTLLALFLLLPLTSTVDLWKWLLSAGIWSFAFGLRGIIWHQISDLRADELGKCATAATTIGEKKLALAAGCFIFPLELLSFGYLLLLSDNVLSYVFLLLHVVVEFLNFKYMQAGLIIVSPKENGRFILFEYYQLFLPLSMLLSLTMHESAYGIALVVFMILFAEPIQRLLKILLHLIRWRVLPVAFDRSKQKDCAGLERFEQL